ncbi:MAG: helix-turn-helix domain-containing protein [Planctomycetota bacterium]
MPKLMSIKEVAEYLGVCINTIRRLIWKGELPASRVGGQWRIEEDALNLYLKKKAYFAGDIAFHQLYFRQSVLDVYLKEPTKYYVQEEGFHGRLGNKADRYKDHTAKSNAWVVGAEASDFGVPAGEFPELKFWKVKLKSGEMAVMVDPKAFYKLLDDEQNKWQPYRILNPQI